MDATMRFQLTIISIFLGMWFANFHDWNSNYVYPRWAYQRNLEVYGALFPNNVMSIDALNREFALVYGGTREVKRWPEPEGPTYDEWVRTNPEPSRLRFWLTGQFDLTPWR